MKTWADVGIQLPSGAHGREVSTTCPQCSPQRKKKHARCLSANIETGKWHCNHCGWSGGLEERNQRWSEPAWRKPKYRTPEPRPATDLPRQVVEWFASRGIGEKILARNKIGYGSVYMPQIEDHTNAIEFPYFRGGEIINRKYRDGRKNFRMETGAERILYGLDDVGETLVWVEGEVDKLSVEVAALLSCVSVPDGAPAEGTKDYSSKFTFLDSAEATLAKVKRHVIAVDSDAPGRLLEDELARRLGREKCWRVRWPEGCKDANEVLVKYGAPELRDLIEHAEPFPIEGVFTTLDESPKIYSLYRNGFERGQSTGWASLDRHYTVRPGEFTVVTGIPSHGKSNFLDALLVNLAKKHGWSFGFFSPENQPIEDHMSRIIEKWAALPFSDGPRERMNEAELESGIKWSAEHFAWILPNDETNWEIDWILARAKELVYRKGIRGLVIDPWNELEAQKRAGEHETDYVSRVLRVVRQFARQHGIHVWMVVHPAKLYRDAAGAYPVPTLYDCSGSAHWRNKADNGLCVWRDVADEMTREVQIHVSKIRFRQIGKPGVVSLWYDPPTGDYSDLTPPIEQPSEERYR